MSIMIAIIDEIYFVVMFGCQVESCKILKMNENNKI